MAHNTEKTEIEIDGRKLQLTNLNKVFWKEEGYTKGDVIDYYLAVSDLILPYLINRPQVLHRNPNGLQDVGFYQKNVTEIPGWIKTFPIVSESEGKPVNYVLCPDKATLIYLINLGCIELNPWTSQVDSLDYPDYSIIDLDPVNVNFEEVIESAWVVKEVLDEFKINSFCKTSGKKGIHILIPLGAKYTYEQSRQFAELIVSLAHQKLPAITSLERSPKKRDKKVYLDFLQNSYGQTIAAPYSLRPSVGACVSTPLQWNEVKKGLLPIDFTIKNAIERFKKKGDLFDGLLTGEAVDLKKTVNRIAEFV